MHPPRCQRRVTLPSIILSTQVGRALRALRALRAVTIPTSIRNTPMDRVSSNPADPTVGAVPIMHPPRCQRRVTIPSIILSTQVGRALRALGALRAPRVVTIPISIRNTQMGRVSSIPADPIMRAAPIMHPPGCQHRVIIPSILGTVTLHNRLSNRLRASLVLDSRSIWTAMCLQVMRNTHRRTLPNTVMRRHRQSLRVATALTDTTPMLTGTVQWQVLIRQKAPVGSLNLRPRSPLINRQWEARFQQEIS